MRVVSQHAYKQLRRIVREEAAKVAAARTEALAQIRAGVHREVAIDGYMRHRWQLQHYSKQLAAVTPSTEKHPEWSPAARARNHC
jgi:hypothetical protein